MLASIATLTMLVVADVGGPAMPAELTCLAKSYRVEPVLDGGEWFAAIPGGTRIPFDDHKSKSFEERLARPT